MTMCFAPVVAIKLSDEMPISYKGGDKMKYKKALKILGYWLLSSCMFFGTAMLFVLLFSSFSSLGVAKTMQLAYDDGFFYGVPILSCILGPIFGLMFLPEFR
jgi:hypothetical protein